MLIDFDTTEEHESFVSSVTAAERFAISLLYSLSINNGLTCKHFVTKSTRRTRTSKQSSTGNTNPAGMQHVLAIRFTVN